MSTHKSIDKICAICAAIAVVIVALFSSGALGITALATTVGYENRIFATDKVHTIDIVMDDWDTFIANCTSEEYYLCSVVIDGEALKNVAIRAKGNTSLSNVASMDSDRYSFKIEFDHYDSTKTYHGLDKLNLNNIIQDTTYMKDYLSYTLMRSFGVDTPLCSYAYITVNGEDWGLYLAVEGVEDAFLERNYSSVGNLYKPDSQSMAAGGMDFDDFDASDRPDMSDFDASGMPQDGGFDPSNRPEPDGSSDSFSPPDAGNFASSDEEGEAANIDSDEAASSSDNSDDSQLSGDVAPQYLPDGSSFNPPTMPNGDNSDMPGGDFTSSDFGGGFGGMGTSDVKLQYIDDDPDSYSNIFDNAKTDITDADKERLISSLKQLSENDNIENVVNIDEVMRYFVVHIFLCNGDSYTGSMIHNYYLYENDGKLSMIPWDYNLAFGTFQSSDATAEVNAPIDTPVSGGYDDRPMIAWIFNNEEYTEMYHEYFSEFLSSVDISSIIDETKALISSYVEKDPTAFYTYDEFETGVETLKAFCELRVESIEGQLDGTIPSTTSGQSEDSSALIDASSITLSDMGTMNNGGGEPGGQNKGPGEMPGPGSLSNNSFDNNDSADSESDANTIDNNSDVNTVDSSSDAGNE